VLLGLQSRYSSDSHAWPAVSSTPYSPWALSRFHHNLAGPKGRWKLLSSGGIPSSPPVGLFLIQSLYTLTSCCLNVILRNESGVRFLERASPTQLSRRIPFKQVSVLLHQFLFTFLWWCLIYYGADMSSAWHVNNIIQNVSPVAVLPSSVECSNLAVGDLALMLHIQQTSGSNLDPEIVYRHWDFSWFSWLPPGNSEIVTPN
jgi:hypothetical protein